MNLFRQALKDITEKRERLKSGGFNAIPFNLPELSKHVPGIMNGVQYGLTAESGASKSKFLRYNFVKTPYDFYLKHKDTSDIDIEIFIFCLEDSADTTMKNIIASTLADQKRIRLSTLSLNSYLANQSISDRILREIESLDAYMEHFLSKVHIIDNVRNPYGIYRTVIDKLLHPSNGYYVDEQGKPLSMEDLKAGTVRKFYHSRHSNKFVIVGIDNLQNIEMEKADDGSKWKASDNLCRRYLRNELCNVFKTCNIIIQQQEKSSAKAQFTNSGSQIIDKLLPSVAGLSEYKNSVDSAHCLFGLFNPFNHRIKDFITSSGSIYDIEALGDYYRNLSVIKSNFAPTLNISLFFDSFAESFHELPHPTNIKMAELYNYIEKLEKEKSNKYE